MIDRAIAVIGIALALIGLVAPLQWPNMKRWVQKALLLAGVLLFGLAIGLVVGDSRGDGPEARDVRTLLRVQFFGDERVPTAIDSQNISNWYALWSPSATMTFADAQGKALEEHRIVPKSWTLFVLFDKATRFKELTVSFSTPGFPQYEVKQATPRFAIVAIAGDPPAGSLEVYAKP